MQTQTHMNGAGLEAKYLRAAADFRALDTHAMDTRLGVVAKQHGLPPAELKQFMTRYEMPKAKSPDGFDSFGEMLLAVARAGQQNATPDRRLQAAASGMSEAIGSEGGYLISQERTIDIRTRTYASGELLQRVTKLPLGKNANSTKLLIIDDASRADGSRHGGVRAYWAAEAGEKTPTRPTFQGETELKLKKLVALVYATDELLADASMLEGWINHALPDELRLQGERAILTGTGAGQPLGIFNTNAAIEVAPESGQGLTFNFSNVLSMWERLQISSRANAVWFVSQGVERYLYTMALPIGVGGVPIFTPANIQNGDLYPRLMGRPVIPSEYMQPVGTKGDVMLADLGAYLWIDKGAVQGASSVHVRFVFDETCFRFTWRVDGAPEWTSPLTPMNGGPTVSSVVVLGSR